MRQCNFEGCDKPHHANGLCTGHDTQRFRRQQLRPLRDKISPQQRFWEKVTKTEDGCWVWTGTINKSGHGQFWDGKTTVYAHRYAWELMGHPTPDEGWFHPFNNPKGLVLDHDDEGKGCNRPECVNPNHLQPVPQKINIRNRRGLNVNNKSGEAGVHWHKQSKKWVAKIKRDGREIHIGLYDTIEEAAAARRARIKEIDS